MNTKSMTSPSVHMYEFAEDGHDRGDNPLVLSFAYSLTPEGAPGLYNQILAQTIMTDWAGKKPWIGVQWEIRDAMDDLQLLQNLEKVLSPHEPLTTNLLKRLHPRELASSDTLKVHTAPPFSPVVAQVKDKDTVDWRAFRERLLNSLDTNGEPAVAVVAETIAESAQQVGYAGENDAAVLQKALYSSEQVAIHLDRLIQTKTNYHKVFWTGNGSMLDLHDRQRKAFGPVGFEKRELPSPNRDLGQYQNQRINRLIVEAICPDRSVLPEPGYLSTRGVLRHLFNEMPVGERDFDRVFIYGSPVHSARCRRQFIEFAWSVGWPIDPKQVEIIYFGDDMSDCRWIWDEKTAQVWCRSKAAWDAYETNNARLR